MLINEDFIPKREKNSRLPQGQYETKDFPVLSFGPTPKIEEGEYFLRIFGNVKNELILKLADLKNIESDLVSCDVHCVTKWSKLDTKWRGVSLSKLVEKVVLQNSVSHLIAHSYDGYSTNLPIEDILYGKAFVVYEYEGSEITREHGGPVRLLVPHLYFWKSAKWLNALEFVNEDKPGFWETRGYHNHGDPWKEERYTND